MSELPPTIRKFLEETRSAHDPARAAQARVWLQLGGRLGVPLPPLTMPTAPPPPPMPPAAAAPHASALPQALGAGAKVTAKLTLVKLLSGVLLVAAGGAALKGYDRVSAQTAAPPAGTSVASSGVRPAGTAVRAGAAADGPAVLAASPASAEVDSEALPDPAAVASPPPSATVAPTLSSVSSSSPLFATAPRDTGAARPAASASGAKAMLAASNAPVSPGPAALTSPNASTLSGELTLVGDAEAALGRGDVATALALTDEHARLFPAGTLRLERMATRALALCAVHRNAEAQSLASTLAREAPRSPYADRLRASCAGWPGR